MSYTISLVDDDEVKISTLTILLRKAGYSVFSSTNGKDALREYESRMPNLILLDVDMPEMTGFELLRILKAKPEFKDVPVIFLSGHEETDAKLKGLEDGAVDFISKITEDSEVIARVKVHLENSLLQKQLKESNDKKNKFFSIIAKDMKGNLAQIITGVQSLEDYIEGQDLKSLKESLSHLSSRSKKTMFYLKNLLDYARLQTGGFNIHLYTVNITNILNETMKNYQDKIAARKINIQNAFENKDIYLKADEYSLRVILENLISNVVKYTNFGEYIQFKYRIENDEITVSVLNKGFHFSKEQQDRVFNFDHSNDSSPNPEEQGSGLGLVMTKELVEKNGGRFFVNSESGITEVGFVFKQN